MGQMYYEKWRKANPETMRLRSGQVDLMTNLRMFGKYYMCDIRLVEGTMPPTLGREFFERYGWSIGFDGRISSPTGDILITSTGEDVLRGKIEDMETERVYKCSQLVMEMEGEKDKTKVLTKLHKYFGHVSPEALYRILKASTVREKFTEAEIREINDACYTCNTNKRKMSKKKTSLPRASGFNQVVTMDLKVHSMTEYVLWLVDDATRLIRGEVIKDKRPETVLNALERAWIIGRGAGPGLPERYFFSDNGGEFVNETMTNYLQQSGIRLKTTASFSPQQNGVNERNHASADILVTKFRQDYPNMSLQEAVHRAAYARNCDISATRGFSAFQMVYGRNPGILGLSECTTGSLETFTPNEMGRQMIVKMERARELLMQTESDIRLKIAMKDRLPREPGCSLNIGDQVTFRDHKEHKMRTGVITGFEGPIALINWCNHERRVPSRECMPLKERRELMEDGETDIDSAEEYIQEIKPARQDGPVRKKVEIIPSLTSIEVERELRERRRLSDVLSEESDHLPKYKVFTQSEGESEKEEPRKENKSEKPPLPAARELRPREGKKGKEEPRKGNKPPLKNPPPASRGSRSASRGCISKRVRDERSLPPAKEINTPVDFECRPKRFREVRLTMDSGGVIEGRVSAIEKCSSNWFFLDTGDEKYRPINIEEVDEWIYLDE
jgi:hypothetical protein